jgi:hypothetical protein
MPAPAVAYVVDWTAVSAVATAAAAIVALTIPFVMSWLDRRARARERRTAIEEICHAVDGAVICFERARCVTKDRCSGRPSSYESIGYEAASIHRALSRMLARAGLTDGALISGSAAEMLAQSVGVILEDTQKDVPELLLSRLDNLKPLALRALERAERVRTYNRVPRRKHSTAPTLLASLGAG